MLIMLDAGHYFTEAAQEGFSASFSYKPLPVGSRCRQRCHAGAASLCAKIAPFSAISLQRRRDNDRRRAALIGLPLKFPLLQHRNLKFGVSTNILKKDFLLDRQSCDFIPLDLQFAISYFTHHCSILVRSN